MQLVQGQVGWVLVQVQVLQGEGVTHRLCIIVIAVTLAITDNHRYLSDYRS
jgi:hypothetical protein